MILASTQENIAAAGAILRAGGIVGMPTETVYGLAARFDVDEAVRMIFEKKGRPADNPLIVHVASIEQAQSLVKTELHSLVELLAAHLWPGPFTMVLDKAPHVSDLVSAGLSTVAVRMPNHPVALRLIKECGSPLAAPSANTSGTPSPTTAEHVMQDLGKELLVLDGGPCQIGIESTVARITPDSIIILRPGVVTAETLAQITGLAVRSGANADERMASPGTRYRHYAPRTPMKLVGTVDEVHSELKIQEGQVMVLARPPLWLEFPGILVGSLNEHDLYAELRRADDLHVGCIVVLCDEVLKGQVALMNRLRKAAGEDNDGEAGT
ncbi:MAG: threonylcarbamoyl-AMP synthase [Candidatus Kapabacteria bacterium]|nr:threonylcarbamoyl-AMP synthase [Candidatus Kapabacteria bacterium]